MPEQSAGDKLFTLRMPVAMFSALEREAARRGAYVPLAAVVRDAIAAYLPAATNGGHE